MAAQSNSDVYPNSSLGRAVRILEAFDARNRTLSAKELVEITEIPLSSLYRQLNQMLVLGLLEKTQHHRYRKTAKLWALAASGSATQQLIELALPYMEELQKAVQQGVQLSILIDTVDVLFIERLRAPKAVMNIMGPGVRVPAKLTSSGLLLAALSDSATLEAVLAHDVGEHWLVASPPHRQPIHNPSLAELQETIAVARTTEICRVDSWLAVGVTGISAPIRDAEGSPVAALSLIIPTEERLLERITPALSVTSTALSRHLKTLSVRFPALSRFETSDQ